MEDEAGLMKVPSLLREKGSSGRWAGVVAADKTRAATTRPASGRKKRSPAILNHCKNGSFS